jgi:hypothetical protein
MSTSAPPDAYPRLNHRISASIETRLKLAALVSGQQTGHFLAAHLDKTLPSLADLTARLSGAGDD